MALKAPARILNRIQHLGARVTLALVLSTFPTTTSAQLQATARESTVGAYERATFILNINPVVWEQLRAESTIIADRLKSIEPGAANSLSYAVDHLIGAATKPRLAPADDDLPPNREEAEEHEPMPRQEAARQAFELLTRSVAKIVLHDITLLSADPSIASLARLRADYSAFSETIQISDRVNFDRLQKDLDAIEDYTRAGICPAANRPAVTARCEDFQAYISENFGAEFHLLSDRQLAPWPVASSTLDRTARLPFRLPAGSRIAKPLPRPRQILNSVERGAKERETPLISLGAALFNNPFIFGEPARSLEVSCNTCHNKSGINPSFFIPGLSRHPGSVDVTNSIFAPHANNGVFDPLDIPDLRGIRFTAPYGRNGRTASLRDFTRNVIVNEFNGDEPDPFVLDSIVAYMNEFDFLRNPALNANGTLNRCASAEARRGEAIFMRPFDQFGKLSCASCHIPSANFVDHLRHDIGSMDMSYPSSRDRALDTPTLLGTMFTAPYFHDGSLPTLRAVVEWFDTKYQLKLSADELRDLTAYVSTVGNGTHAMESGDRFVAEDMEDQESFLSAFEFLAERGKWGLIANLFRGISLETGHQAPLLDPRTKEAVVRLGDLLTVAANAADQGTTDEARAKVLEWRRLYNQIKYDLK